MRASLHRCAFVFLFLCLLPAYQARAETRVALIVGNAGYEHVTSLDNPLNDALDVSVALEGLGFDLTLHKDLKRADTPAVLSAFAKKAKTADVVLFYYAGHGVQISGENFLLPVDAEVNEVFDLPAQATALSAVLEAMKASEGLKLVILDACRDNPFGEELEFDAEGLARAGKAADFMFVYATQPDSVAYDGTGRNSFFTESLLNHIYTPGQDIAELLTFVRRDVLAATGGRQIPWESSSLTRRFQFDDSGPTASEETLLWQVAAQEGSTELMQLYLDRYPLGRHVADVEDFLTRSSALQIRPEAVPEGWGGRLWNIARRTRLRPLFELYLQKYPGSAKADEAKRFLALLPKPEEQSPGQKCERLATHPQDSTSMVAGVPFTQLQRHAISAVRACAVAVTRSPDLPHYVSLLARATHADGDLGRAVSLYQTAAARGDLRALVTLGRLHETGNGVPQDMQLALQHYEAAAQGGSLDAMNTLAVILFEGDLTPPDPDRAIALLRKAAKEGSAKAIFNLGVLAMNEAIDTPQDALSYFQQAARHGEPAAYRAAAILLDEGRGIGKDPDAAARLLLFGLAEDDGTLLREIITSPDIWTKATWAALQGRLTKAGLYRGGTTGAVTPELISALSLWRDGGFAEAAVAQ